MFYRYQGATRIPVDLDGLYSGTVFLLGGHPSLADADLDLLRQPGIATLAMNNVPSTFPRPTLWIGMDKPACFISAPYLDPGTQAFTIISRRDLEVTPGVKVRECPATYFFGSYEPKTEDFCRPHRDIVWLKSVFPAALQLAIRLGFGRVAMLGCAFSGGGSYAWPTALTTGEADYSQRTYDQDLTRLRGLLPVLAEGGVDLISCTPGSRAHDLGIPYVPLEEATTPLQIGDTRELPHSSRMKKGK